MRDIDRLSPVPIYHQLKMLIRERIRSGLWQPGDRISTEREICETYDISRSPVRQALNELAHEGILVRRPGLGTFVVERFSADVPSDTSVRIMCSDPHWSAMLERVSSIWNERHPDQMIAFEIDVVSHDRLYDLLSAMVGSGTAPDVAMVDSVWVAGLADAGFLYALEDVDAPANHAHLVESLHPVFIQANSLDGRLYGLPIKADASLLWYRKDWFAQEGLAAPRNWDELLTVSTHFLQPQVRERYGLAHPLAFPAGTAAGEATVYCLLPFIWSAGGEVVDIQAGRVTLDSPKTSRALRFLRGLVQTHGVSPPEVVKYRHDTSCRVFAEGRVAMALGGSYEAEHIQTASRWSDTDFIQRVGTAMPPPPPGREPISTVGGTSYVVLRQCEFPTLAVEVLKAATDPHVIKNLYRSLGLSLPSPTSDTMLVPGVDAFPAQVSRMINEGRARPPIPQYVKVSRQLEAMFEAAISGGELVEDVVQRTASFISVITELPCVSAQLLKSVFPEKAASL